eukprot:TRINITY_DN11463_c1_g1_i1.p1 TRINITY_DN11463_c1_g1~~TRINITY_DN11463_c1_g1_i1.p1  ORF type:complete len:218 (+),score=40.47 TRINITY_DN11463_c1_g1_i1:57-710(+)
MSQPPRQPKFKNPNKKEGIDKQRWKTYQKIQSEVPEQDRAFLDDLIQIGDGESWRHRIQKLMVVVRGHEQASDATLLVLVNKVGVQMDDLLCGCIAADCPLPESLGAIYEPLQEAPRLADSRLVPEVCLALEATTSEEYNACLIDTLRELMKWRGLASVTGRDTAGSGDSEDSRFENTIMVVSICITMATLCIVAAALWWVTNGGTLALAQRYTREL